MDVRNELESSASDSHARPRSLVDIIKYRLHNQFATIPMPFPLRWWLAPGIDFKPRHPTLIPVRYLPIIWHRATVE